MDLSPAQAMPMRAHERRSGALPRTLLIGFIAFLTVIDLFGTQAILPALAQATGVAAPWASPSTPRPWHGGRGLGVAYFSRLSTGGAASWSASPFWRSRRRSWPLRRRRLHGAAHRRRARHGRRLHADLGDLGQHLHERNRPGVFAAITATSRHRSATRRRGLADHLGAGRRPWRWRRRSAGAALASVRPDPRDAHDGDGRGAARHVEIGRGTSGRCCDQFAIVLHVAFTARSPTWLRAGAQPLAVGPMALGSCILVFAPSSSPRSWPAAPSRSGVSAGSVGGLADP